MKIKLFTMGMFFALLLLYASSGHTRGLVKVCILPFEEYSLDRDKLMKAAVVQELEMQLSLNPYFIVCESHEVQQVLDELGVESFTEQNLRTVAKHLGANFLVLGSITKIMDDMSVDVEVFNDFHPITYFKAFADGTDLRRVVNDVSGDIVRNIMEKESFIPPAKRPEGEVRDILPEEDMDIDMDLDFYLETLLDEHPPVATDEPESLFLAPEPSEPQEPVEEGIVEDVPVPAVETVVIEEFVDEVTLDEPAVEDTVDEAPEPVKPEKEMRETEERLPEPVEPEKEDMPEEKPRPEVTEEAVSVEEPVRAVPPEKTADKKERDRFDFAASDQPINISADSLEYDNRANRARFEGNVVARQGDMVIFSKTMEVAYSADGGIREANAEGAVRVVQGDRIATGDRIVFDNIRQMIVATGNARVWQGDNVIQGRTITVYLLEDRAVVEGGPEGRVSATVVPGR